MRLFLPPSPSRHHVFVPSSLTSQNEFIAFLNGLQIPYTIVSRLTREPGSGSIPFAAGPGLLVMVKAELSYKRLWRKRQGTVFAFFDPSGRWVKGWVAPAHPRDSSPRSMVGLKRAVTSFGETGRFFPASGL